MNKTGNSNWPLVLSAIAALLIGGIATYLIIPTGPVQANLPADFADQIASKIVISVPETDVNVTKIDEIYTQTFKDDNWKSTALDLATSEWSASKNKDIFNFLVSQNYSIVEKTDIDKVVIKDEDIVSFDSDEFDATVEQSLKVYYEDSDGNDLKVYIDVTTEIEDNDVDDQEFTIV